MYLIHFSGVSLLLYSPIAIAASSSLLHDLNAKYLFKSSHIHSIGFRSGELGGALTCKKYYMSFYYLLIFKLTQFILNFSRTARHFKELCLGSLSWCKKQILSSYLRNLCKKKSLVKLKTDNSASDSDDNATDKPANN